MMPPPRKFASSAAKALSHLLGKERLLPALQNVQLYLSPPVFGLGKPLTDKSAMLIPGIDIKR